MMAQNAIGSSISSGEEATTQAQHWKEAMAMETAATIGRKLQKCQCHWECRTKLRVHQMQLGSRQNAM
jgi:hypothetical protein